MKYINAKNLLPDALVKELQSYIQGGYLYVPADQAQQKRWGEASGYRQELQQRNRRIVEEFRNGISMEELAEKSGRFHYELACDIGKRVPRRFWKDGKIIATQDYFSENGINE